MTANIAILGYGNVGRALVQLLLRKDQELRSRVGYDWRIVGAMSRRRGAALNPDGLDPQTLAEAETLGPSMDAFQFIQTCRANVLVELTVLNPQTGQPALDHTRAALQAGMHVVTANKGPVAFGYRELAALAAGHGVDK